LLCLERGVTNASPNMKKKSLRRNTNDLPMEGVYIIKQSYNGHFISVNLMFIAYTVTQCNKYSKYVTAFQVNKFVF